MTTEQGVATHHGGQLLHRYSKVYVYSSSEKFFRYDIHARPLTFHLVNIRARSERQTRFMSHHFLYRQAGDANDNLKAKKLNICSYDDKF